jgi:hypothetical protein
MELLIRNSDAPNEAEGREEGAPSFAKPIPWYEADVMALKSLTEPQLPHYLHVRSKFFITVSYGFVDASGKVFGSKITIDGSLLWRSGQWKEFYEDESSNRREFENVVIASEESYSKTGIHDMELFMFTDNMVSENAFYRGTSSSPFFLISVAATSARNSWWLETAHDSHCWKAHDSVRHGRVVSGDMISGVMGGFDMLSFFPLRKRVDERSGILKRWVHTWWKNDSPVRWLMPEGWF